MFRDPERKLYNAVGLRTSLGKTWHINTLTWFADQIRAQRAIPTMMKNDDPHQMGGDFIISKQGEMAYMYGSKSAPDRPSVEVLLEEAQKLQQPGNASL